MRKFEELYLLTDPGPAGLPSAFLDIPGIEAPPAAGAYDNGLLAVVDTQWSTTGLHAWRWLLKPTHRALMTTGFGDVFLWEPREGVSFLEVQRAELELVDPDVNWFLNEFLCKSSIIEEVLRKPRFEELVTRHGPLRYHGVFILKPWLMLGGQDKIENYGPGDCRVYLDLVGQSCKVEKES